MDFDAWGLLEPPGAHACDGSRVGLSSDLDDLTLVLVLRWIVSRRLCGIYTSIHWLRLQTAQLTSSSAFPSWMGSKPEYRQSTAGRTHGHPRLYLAAARAHLLPVTRAAASEGIRTTALLPTVARAEVPGSCDESRSRAYNEGERTNQSVHAIPAHSHPGPERYTHVELGHSSRQK